MLRRMVTLTVAVALPVALALFVTPATAHCRSRGGHGIGAGLILGEPTGLSLQVAPSDPIALNLALGTGYREDVHAHFDLIARVPIARGPNLSFPLYVGGGLLVADRRDAPPSDLGARVPFGFELNLQRAPIQVFGEVVPTLLLYDPVVQHPRPNPVVLSTGVGIRLFL